MARKSVTKKTVKKAVAPAEKAAEPAAATAAGAKSSEPGVRTPTPASNPPASKSKIPETAPTDIPKDAKDPAAASAKDSSGDSEEDLGTFVSIKPPPPKPKSGAWAGAMLTLAVAAGVGIGAVVTQDIWRPKLDQAFPGLLPSSAPDPMVAGLVGRMTALETQLRERADAANSLAKLEAERQQFSGALKTIIDRLETVEGQLSDVRRMAEAASGAPTVGVANQSLKEIRDRLTRVEQSGGETSAVLQRLSELEKSGGELSEVRKRVDALQAAGGDARTMTKTLSVVEGRLAELEQARVAAGVTSTTTDAKARALVLAVAQLRDTVRRGAAFAADLETLSDLAAGDTDVAAASATLARHAKTGIPTLAMLREQFDGLAGHLLSAARSAPDDTWWQRAANQVSALVSVRRVGTDADGNSLDAVIARAENLMRAGDLKGAVAAIDGAAPQLNEAAMALAKPWLKSAKARLSAERALTALHVKAVALLVPASG